MLDTSADSPRLHAPVTAACSVIGPHSIISLGHRPEVIEQRQLRLLQRGIRPLAELVPDSISPSADLGLVDPEVVTLDVQEGVRC